MGSILSSKELFHEGPEGPELLGSNCKSCGKFAFPRRRICPACQSDEEMAQVSLSRKGKLYTYTIVRQGLKGFETPYALGFVDLPEGVRVFAQLTVFEPWALQVGMEVELVLGKVASRGDGEDVISYRFRPVLKQ